MRFRILAAGLALLAHTFAIGALCLCSAETVIGGMKAQHAEMSCHESAPELSISSLQDCCCDNNPSQGETSSLVAKRTLDEVSFSTPQPWALSIPLTPALRMTLPSLTHRGAMPPRPPLRV